MYVSFSPVNSRINRNIVECKESFNLIIVFSGTSVLIETSWNVKVSRFFIRSIGRIGINRNIVECKVEATAGEKHYREVLIETSWNVKTVRGGNRHRIE